MKSRRRVNSAVMLLTPSMKSIACVIACLFALCAGPTQAQTTRHRRHVARKRTKTLVQGQPVDGGNVCGKPITLVTSATDPSVNNTVTVQVTINEKGNVVDARAVSGDAKLQSYALENAKQQKFGPKLLSGKPVKVLGVIVYKFEKP
jgi:hypothetical protein